MKLSNKTKSKIERRRFSNRSAGYNFDNGEIAFGMRERRSKDIHPVDGPFVDGQAGIAGSAK